MATMQTEPERPSFVPPADTFHKPPAMRELLAKSLEVLAGRVRAGELPWTNATVVFHAFDTRSVEVQNCGVDPRPRIDQENAALAALQRAVVRWSLPLE